MEGAIEGTIATSSSVLNGGVVCVFGSAVATLTSVAIDDTATTSDYTLKGGVFYIYSGAIATLRSVAVEGIAALSSSYLNGGVLFNNGGGIATLDRCTIANATAISSTMNVLGGCLGSFGILQLVATNITGCHAIAASPGRVAESGGAHIGSGQLIMSQGTSFDGCVADIGSTLSTLGGTAVYMLPAPPGRWVAAAKCKVYREACDTTTPSNNFGGSACPSVRAACSALTTTNATVDSVGCEPLLFSQPCDWSSMPQLLGNDVHALPQAPINVDYPYRCAAGLLGSNSTEGQSTALCGGPTPAGTYQPDEAGTAALECTAGEQSPT